MIAPKGSSNFSNRVVFVILGVAALIILILAVVFVMVLYGSLSGDSGSAAKGGLKNNPKETYPKGEDASGLTRDKVMKAFLLELREEQLEDAYQRTSIGFQGSMSQGDFNAMIQKNKALIGHVTYRYANAGQPGTFKGHVGGGPNGGCDFTLEIGQEDQGWRIRKFSVP